MRIRFNIDFPSFKEYYYFNIKNNIKKLYKNFLIILIITFVGNIVLNIFLKADAPTFIKNTLIYITILLFVIGFFLYNNRAKKHYDFLKYKMNNMANIFIFYDDYIQLIKIEEDDLNKSEDKLLEIERKTIEEDKAFENLEEDEKDNFIKKTDIIGYDEIKTVYDMKYGYYIMMEDSSVIISKNYINEDEQIKLRNLFNEKLENRYLVKV